MSQILKIFGISDATYLSNRWIIIDIILVIQSIFIQVTPCIVWKNHSGKLEITNLNKRVFMTDFHGTFPSPAEWNPASVERIMIFRTLSLHPISSLQTIACIRASKPPSGLSRFVEILALLTLVWKMRICISYCS